MSIPAIAASHATRSNGVDSGSAVVVRIGEHVDQADDGRGQRVQQRPHRAVVGVGDVLGQVVPGRIAEGRRHHYRGRDDRGDDDRHQTLTVIVPYFATALAAIVTVPDGALIALM